MILAAASGRLPGGGNDVMPLLPAVTKGLGSNSAAAGGYAANVIREMYGDSLPKAAQQLLKDHTRLRSSSAPPRAKAWAATGVVRDDDSKPRRRVVELKVPRVGRGAAHSASETGFGAPPRPPKMPKRRSHADIVRDTNNYERQDEPSGPPLRDWGEQKERLQDLNSFGFGSALPNTRAPPGMPVVQRRRVAFSSSVPPSREGSPVVASGLPSEQEAMATEIVRSVRERQKELDCVEEALQKFVDQAEAPGAPTSDRRRLQKQMVHASKERLALRSAIQKDVQDLQQLIDLSPSG